jgi:hypothetical protein
MAEHKALSELIFKISSLGNVEGSVGWLKKERYPDDGEYVAQVAYTQEFGNSYIPARPFMRPAAINNKNKWQNTINKVSAQVLVGKLTNEQAMQLVVSQAEGDVLESIKAVDSPPLSPVTIGARKYRREGKKVTSSTLKEIRQKIDEGKLDLSGVSTKPLNDTGYMISTVTTNVEIKK